MTQPPALLSHAAQQTYPASCLYVVATPIGNVADITFRALYVLSMVDAIACEDTRHTTHLLKQIGISKPLIAAHQHNENDVAQKIIQRLQRGERIALVSDAGTPAISDPGAKIVRAVHDAHLTVMPLPGACALTTALSASGLIHDQFYFVGFLPNKAGQRNQLLTSLKNIPATLIFYEAPHRIVDTVNALSNLFPGDRTVVFAREVTKLFEEIYRCELSKAHHWLVTELHRQKGEFVILLEGAATKSSIELMEAQRILQILLTSCSVKQTVHLAAQITGQKKNVLYQIALDISANLEQSGSPSDR